MADKLFCFGVAMTIVEREPRALERSLENNLEPSTLSDGDPGLSALENRGEGPLTPILPYVVDITKIMQRNHRRFCPLFFIWFGPQNHCFVSSFGGEREL